MIPILYKAKEQDFSHNGLGALGETISCFVTEARNGLFELELTYPVTGRLFSEIEVDRIIKAKANDTSALQLFRIYKHSKPINGVVTYNAEHISYELNGIPIETVSVKNASGSAALNAILSSAVTEHKYKAWSDIDTLNSLSLSMLSVRAALGGSEGSLLDVYGGEFEFDNYTVKLHKARGKDTGIRIAYGKNLTDIKQDTNISSVYTAVFPYARYTSNDSESEETTITLPEKLIYSTNASSFAASRTCFKDFSDCFNDENPTIDSLRDVAQKWVQTSEFDIPQISFTVSFKHLWKSPEYRKYAALERVSLCDTVCVYYEKLGISAKAKVIKTVYNTLKEDYESLDLGDAKANFADSITSADSAIENVKNDIKRQNTAVNVKLAQAIAEATAAITGQNGGYVVLNPPKNPQEILIMDSPNIETAVNVWRWNSAGLGHSSTGYNGKFALAMTADGSIVADFITTGNLNGALISAESIKANAISAEYKKEVTDEIGSSKESVTQEFKAADEELKSTIEKELEGLSAKSEIKQLNDKISLIVTAKDGENKVDSAAIVAAINDETSTVLINAGKIDLTAYAKTSEIEDAADEAASEAINRITLSTTDGEKSSTIKILYDGVEIGSAEIKLTGAVTFADLSAAGKTAINGGNITTGKISAERIDVANLLIKKLYSQGTGTGHYLKIASGFGDFGIFQNTAADDATPTSADCVLGMYNDFGNAINFYTYGNNFFGYNLNSHKVFPKEAWDFSSAEVTGLAVRFS